MLFYVYTYSLIFYFFLFLKSLLLFSCTHVQFYPTFKFLNPHFLEFDYISNIFTYVIVHLVLYLNLDLNLVLDLG
jgi:hypothetical protein